MSAAKTILITGATGNVGSATVKHLASLLSKQSSNYVIRAGVRDVNKAKEQFKSVETPKNGRIEYVNTSTSAENNAPENSLKSAFQGVDSVLILPPAQGRIEVSLKYIQAAQQANVKFIILLSVLTADNDKILFGQQFGQIEKALKSTGINYTIIRAPFFFENHYGNIASIKSQSSFYYPVKPDSRYVQVSVSDLGEAIANIFINPNNHINKTYNVTSNHSASNNEFAQYYTELLGKPVSFVSVPESAAVEAMLGMGFPKWQAEGVVQLWNTVDNKDSVSVNTTNDFRNITGHEPISPKEFIQTMAAAFN